MAAVYLAMKRNATRSLQRHLFEDICANCGKSQNVKFIRLIHPSTESQVAGNVDPDVSNSKDVPKWRGLTKMWDWWNYIKGKPLKVEPKWLSAPQKPTQEAIDSLTKEHVIELFCADSEYVMMRIMTNLVDHMTKHPETKQYAVKMRCIDRLVEILYKTNSIALSQQTRKLLAVMGYAEPPKSKGVRVLSIDGGGMRGLAVIYMLKQLEKLTNKKILDCFDIVCGVSTGAIILGCMLPPKSMTLEEIECCYKNFSKEIFKQNSILGTGKMLVSLGYYDTNKWETLLKNYVGETPLIETSKYEFCPKVLATSTISVQSRVAPFIFRNYGYPGSSGLGYYGTYSASVFESVRASSAAPTIFDCIRIDGIPHMDGGIVLNNPSALAINEAKNLWPDEEISCLVSCGTGIHDPLITMEELRELSQSSPSWTTIFGQIYASATDTEAVHEALNNILVEDIYTRLNPPLSKFIVMHEVDENNLTTLVEDTKMYCRRNKELFEDIAKQLTIPRSRIQKCKDLLRVLRSVLRSQLQKQSLIKKTNEFS